MEGKEKKSIKLHTFFTGPYMPYVTALFGAYGVQGILALSTAENIRYSNSIFSFFVFGLGAYLLNKIWAEYTECDKHKRAWASIYSAMLSIALNFGARLETVENVRMGSISLWLHIIALTIFLSPVVVILWIRSSVIWGKIKAERALSPLKLSQIWAIIFFLWLPTFLAFYPGAFVYDAQEEYIEVITRTFTTHHPLLHVLLLGGIVHGAEYLGYEANTGIAFYVILQMLIMSGILSYTVKRLELLGVKKIYLICVMIFYGLFPLFPMYAVCTAKDGLFMVFLLLMMTELVVYVYDVEEFNPVMFTLSSVLMMLMRNNGVYAFIVSMLIILVCEYVRTHEKKRDQKDRPKMPNNKKSSAARARVYKLTILTLLSIVLYIGSSYILRTATQADDNEHQEILTVPIQQLARAYTYSQDIFDDADIDTLHKYLPEDYLVTYRFRVSDVLKSGFDNGEYDRDPSAFRDLWCKIGLRKPLIYLNAWFGTSYGYWYPDAINNVYAGNQMYTYQYSDSSYFGFETEPPGKRVSKFPVLERFYEKISLELFQQRLPVISMLFSPGFMWWIAVYVICMMIGMGKNSLRALIPLLPAVMVWLTVLLGPTTLVRYVLILWFMIPLYPVLIYKAGYESGNIEGGVQKGSDRQD